MLLLLLLSAGAKGPGKPARTWRKGYRGGWGGRPARGMLDLPQDTTTTRGLPMDKLEFNAETMNALITTLGALVFATVRRLPPDQQAAFASDLARLAKNAERQGDAVLETLLIDMHQAAVAAP